MSINFKQCIAEITSFAIFLYTVKKTTVYALTTLRVPPV